MTAPANPESMRNRRRATFAFTLVELLVVISIIALLAALLLPVFGRVKLNSKIKTAKSDMKNLEAAIQQYYADYSRFPGTLAGANKSTDVTYGDTFTSSGSWNPNTTGITNNSDVVAILMDLNIGANLNNARNPRKIVYFTAPKTVNDTSSAGFSSVDQQFRDPWGTPYVITLDLNGDGYATDTLYSQKAVSQQQLSNGYNGLKDFDQTDVYRLNSPVMIWSAGPDKQATNTVNAISGVNKDNIPGWQ